MYIRAFLYIIKLRSSHLSVVRVIKYRVFVTILYGKKMFEFDEVVNYDMDQSQVQNTITDSDLLPFIKQKEQRSDVPINECFNVDVTVIMDQSTGQRYSVPYNNIIKRRHEKLKTRIDDEVENLKDQRNRYRVENLNKDQRNVFDYVVNNQRNITILQAGPGTGKTFTMLTVAHYLASINKIANVVIYKHDLVDMYRLSTYGYTVAQFMMSLLNISFYEYVALERQLNANMSVEQFINIIVNFVRRCEKINDKFTERLLILDEYTVISKPLLFVLMMVLRCCNVGAVICGDRNQLQNIHNSLHCGNCSAFDIVSAFSHNVFNLTKNERCKDTKYNEIVNFIGNYASNETLDAWGYALVSAIFYKNIVRVPNISDTVLAKEHSMLTDLMDKLVKEHKIPTHPWIIESSSDPQLIQGRRISPIGKEYIPYPMERYMMAVSVLTSQSVTNNNQTPKAELMKHCPGKYLVYLPIIKNNIYFLNDFSERSLCRVLDYEILNNTLHSIRVLRLKDDKEEIVRPRKCNSVMFEKHRSFLLNDGNDTAFSQHGDLINFPLYPAFSMSMYMSQGRTISNNVSFILTRATYECLYVTVSRVTSFNNINSVHIPRNFQFLVSTILNFDLIDNTELDLATLVDRFASSKNYIYYEVPLSATDIQYAALGVITGDTREKRTGSYQTLCHLMTKLQPRTTVINPKPLAKSYTDTHYSSFSETMFFLLKYKNTIMALSFLDRVESCIWIHEFIRTNIKLFATLNKNLIFFKDGTVDSNCSVNRIADITVDNVISISKNEYLQNVAECCSRHEYKLISEKTCIINDESADNSVPVRYVSKFVHDLATCSDDVQMSNDTLFQMLREHLRFTYKRKLDSIQKVNTTDQVNNSINIKEERNQPSDYVSRPNTNNLLDRLFKAKRLRTTKIRKLIKKL